ncbi:helix-turn-helix transcriptional regulator, partial [Citricoccus sp.]|uniref:helix-turn-helix transcriptional regulator n=1 Tax=Citricoccus sp. TaxID=1978372 RepID=UPI0037BF9C52
MVHGPGDGLGDLVLRGRTVGVAGTEVDRDGQQFGPGCHAHDPVRPGTGGLVRSRRAGRGGGTRAGRRLTGGQRRGRRCGLRGAALRLGPAHGHAIVKAIESGSNDVLLVEQGSLYPALHRLIARGWITFD